MHFVKVQRKQFMRSRVYMLYYTLVALFFVAVIAVAVWLLQLDYDRLIAAVTAHVHKNGLEQKIRSELFTRRRFNAIQKSGWLLLLVAPLSAWWFLQYRAAFIKTGSLVITSLRQLWHSFTGVFKNNSVAQNRSFLLLMLLIILFFTYRMISAFLSYDEMWSYNYYTANPFYYSFFTYSSYPLFETTTHFFKWLPLPMKVNLRLSPLLFGLSACVLLYACARKYFNSHLIAMAALTAFACTPLVVVFMASARGVVHELLFAIAGLFSLLFWLRNPEKKYLLAYGIAGVLGLYSMTTHILFLFILSLAGSTVLLKKDKAVLPAWFKIHLLIAVIFSLLYAPIMFTTGTAVFGSVIKSTPGFQRLVLLLPGVMRTVIMGYTGFSSISVTIFFMLTITVLLLHKRWIKERQLIIILAAILPLSAVVYYLITGFPFAGRSLAFGALFITLLSCLLAELLQPWLEQQVGWYKPVSYGFVMAVFSLAAYFYFPVNKKDAQVVTVAKIFLDNNIASCYDNASYSAGFFYYYPGIEYHYRLQQKAIAFTLPQRNSMRYKPLQPEDRYDCIVYNTGTTDSSRLGGYHTLYRDPAGGFVIWLHNQ